MNPTRGPHSPDERLAGYLTAHRAREMPAGTSCTSCFRTDLRCWRLEAEPVPSVECEACLQYLQGCEDTLASLRDRLLALGESGPRDPRDWWLAKAAAWRNGTQTPTRAQLLQLGAIIVGIQPDVDRLADDE